MLNWFFFTEWISFVLLSRETSVAIFSADRGVTSAVHIALIEKYTNQFNIIIYTVWDYFQL